MKLKLKLILGFGIVLLFFLMNIIISVNSIEDSNKKITNIQDVTYKQLQYSTEVNTSVIQIQQFLSDASATKNMDSFKAAEKYKLSFKDSIIKFKAISPNMKDSLNKTDEDFDKYYELGVNMAHVYINDGIEKGNVLMAQFDPMASNLSDEVDKLNVKSSKAMNDDLVGIYNINKRNVQIAVISGGITIILAIIIVILLGRNITIPINNMFNILKDLEHGEGDLTKRIVIKSNDEIGKMAHSFNNFMDKLVNMIGNIKENSHVLYQVLRF